MFINIHPLKGGSYIYLPRNLKNSSKVLINIKNKDDKCFMWCRIAHKNRLSKYINHENDVDYTGIIVPVALN